MTDVFLNKLSLQIDRKWMTVSFDKFYGKIWLGFCLTQENAYSQRFHFKANTKSGSKATAPEANCPILFSPTLKLTLTLTGGGWGVAILLWGNCPYTGRAQVPFKNRTRDFQNSSPFKRSAYIFIWQSLEIWNVFITLTLKKRKAFLKNWSIAF